MFTLNGHMPFFENHDTLHSQTGPPSRLDIHQRKLEHDKMYLNSFEVEQLSRSPRNKHLDQQLAELALIRNRQPNGFDRMRVHLSNLLISIADNIRPSDATHEDMVSAR